MIILQGLTVLLLTYIAFFPIYKSRLTQKKHLQDKIKGIKRQLWDTEFLKGEYKATREGFRVEYDRLKEINDACQVKIGMEKEKGNEQNKELIEQLESQIERFKPDMEQLKKQMDMMDKLIEGPAPEGSPQQPVNSTIDGLRSVIARVQDIIKQL